MKNLIATVKTHLSEYEIKGDEIIAKYCPFCDGGQHRDRGTFALNQTTGLYNCKRGKCGASGNIRQLAEHFGVKESVSYFTSVRNEKIYKKPPWKESGLSVPIVEYFKKRLISEEVLKKNKIGESKGNIVFNYFWDNELIFVKYKIPRKPKKGEQKSWRETDTKPILYGMDFCNPKEPLLIIEGEPDKLVLNEVGIWNVVSIPSGTQDFEWVNHCWEWLEQFKEIIIWGDNDEAGIKWVQQMVSKFDMWKLRVVKSKAKDANELLWREGKEAVLNAFYGAELVGNKRITDLAEIKRIDYASERPISTGFRDLDKMIGGFYLGQLVIWSGYTGGGKSTFISNILINGLKDYKTMAYSGELSKEDFKEIMDFQLLGREKLVREYCPIKEQKLSRPDPRYYKALDEYYCGQMFLFDSEEYADDEALLKAMNYSAKREDVKVFLVDNLMVVPSTDIGTEIEKVTKLVLKFKAFARANNVLVHLVAHPRKPSGDQKRMDLYSVAGSANIVNLADRVIVVHKVRPKDIIEDMSLDGYQTIITIEKDRKMGVFDVNIKMYFDWYCKRFFVTQEEYKREYIQKTDQLYLKSDESIGEVPF